MLMKKNLSPTIILLAHVTKKPKAMHSVYMRTILESMISKNKKFVGRPEEKQAFKVTVLAQNLLLKLKPSSNKWIIVVPITLIIVAGIVYSSCVTNGCQVFWCSAIMNC